MPGSRPPTVDVDPAAADPARLVRIALFRHPIEAHLARARLGSEGIEAALSGEHTAAVLVGVQAVQLLVSGADAERARDILAGDAPPARARGSADWVTGELDAPRCPACRSLRVEAERLLLPLPGLRRRVRCRTCGASWREPRG